MAELVTSTHAAYGAIELKQSYRSYLRRGLFFSVVLSIIALEVYWLYQYYAPKDTPAKMMWLTKYVELQQMSKVEEPPPAPVAIVEGNSQPGGTEGSGAADEWPAGQNLGEPVVASSAPKRMDLASELNDLNALEVGTPVPVQSKLTARGVEGKNTPGVAARGNSAGTSPLAAREGLSSLSEDDFNSNLGFGGTAAGTALPGSGRGRGAGNAKGSGIGVGNGVGAGVGDGAGVGGGLGNGSRTGDAGLGSPGRGSSNRGKGGAAEVKVDLKGLNDFGENYRNFTPIYRGLVEWMRRRPVDLPEVIDRFMGYQPGNLTSRVKFNIGNRELEVFLLCVESTYEIRVCLVDGDEVTHLIDEGFKKQSNYLRVGELTRQPTGEVMRFSSVMREASDRRTQEFYRIFLSWWETVKHEVGG